MTQSFSRANLLLAVVVVAYLSLLLAFVLVAPRFPITEPPGVTLDDPPSPELQLIPPDFRQIAVVSERKQAFFDFMRPLVAHYNSLYAQERQRLLEIVHKKNNGHELSPSDLRKLRAWSEKLFVPAELSPEEKLAMLQRRLNTLPEAMVLAQAAAESGWGRSRFARDAYNYFGQWCYTPGCGLVPRQRSTGAAHEVRKFDSPVGSVRSYFLNINTHNAYRALRDKRLALEQAGEKVTGSALVGELGSYSQRGQLYIDELRLIIRGNNLE